MASGRWNISKKLFFDDDDIARLTGVPGSPNIDVDDSGCSELPQNFRNMPDDEPCSGTSTFPSSAISAPIFTPRHSFPVRDVPLAVTCAPELSLHTHPSHDVAIRSPLRSSLTPEAPTFYPRRSTNYWGNVSLPEAGMFPPIHQSLTRVHEHVQKLPSTFTTETDEAFSGGGFTELSVRRQAQTSRSPPFFVAPSTRRMSTGDFDATTTQLENLCSLLEINASLSSHGSAPSQQHQPRPTWPPGGPGFGRDNICTFCRRNGERQSVYTSHALKDANGNVICPILRRYVCPICRETGDNAHTVSYCPRGRGISTVVETPRKSCGCTRNCMHGVNRHH